jgi:N-alpha-acetyltransferase 35, NatC auxiliary subunit
MKVSELDMPGGYDFTDVTRLFEAASAAMAPDEVILTDGFELQDAMVAFEVYKKSTFSLILV